MMYLAAAGAMYAWRNRSRRKTQRASAADADEFGDGADDAEDDREIEPADRWRDDPPGRGAVGITDLPPDVEADQQASLPARGTRKDGAHA